VPISNNVSSFQYPFWPVSTVQWSISVKYLILYGTLLVNYVCQLAVSPDIPYFSIDNAHVIYTKKVQIRKK